MIIPLGLGSKLYRFPVVTVSLAMVCIVIFSQNTRRPSKIEGEIGKIYEETGLAISEKNLFSEYCLKHDVKAEVCKTLSDEVEKSYAMADGRISKKDTEQKPSPTPFRRPSSEMKLEYEKADFAKALPYAYRFKKEIRDPSEPFSNLESYDKFKDIQNQTDEKLTALFESENLLARSNVTLSALLEAQFSHGSWGHLIGNMIFLLVFGAYVESRIPRLIYLSTYILGGCAGLLIQILFFSDNNTYIVGASANISAVMGLFFVFFFRFRMKFLIWYLAGRTFFAPVSVIFPALYIFQELIAGADNMGAGGIAHFSHLGGLAFGAYTAFALASFFPLDWPFLYPGERRAYSVFIREKDQSKQLILGKKILSYNHQNFHVRVTCLKNIFLGLQGRPLTDGVTEKFLRHELPLAVAERVDHGEKKATLDFLKLIPLHITFPKFLTPLSQREALKLGDLALNQNELLLALRFYDLAIMLFPHSKKNAAIRLTADEVAKHWGLGRDCLDDVKKYVSYHPDSRLLNALISIVNNNSDPNPDRQESKSGSATASESKPFAEKVMPWKKSTLLSDGTVELPEDTGGMKDDKSNRGAA